MESDSSGTPRITYAQLKASTETYKGQAVTLGGKVLSAKRLKDGTRIEILQLPLMSSLKPMLDLSKSQGRFRRHQERIPRPRHPPLRHIRDHLRRSHRIFDPAAR
ncbi:MAG: hypothetical protein HC794_10900 [Nitrospiraceae bacterium]|nr:hypothetical protein [Nitrospiraceae bacterium]